MHVDEKPHRIGIWRARFILLTFGKKLDVVYGLVLRDNYQAINLMKEMGFTVEYSDEDTVKATLNLKEEELRASKG